MNRHILGLTLFLIIVKTSFFVYWGFFAPNSFFSMQTGCHLQTKVQTQTVPRENAPSKKTSCFPTQNSVNNLPSPELQSVTVNLKNSQVLAVVENEFESIVNTSNVYFQLQIFDDKLNPVWAKAMKVKMVRDDGHQLYLMEQLGDIPQFDKKKNYYAQIVPRPTAGGETVIYDIREAAPVLVNYGKK